MTYAVYFRRFGYREFPDEEGWVLDDTAEGVWFRRPLGQGIVATFYPHSSIKWIDVIRKETA